MPRIFIHKIIAIAIIIVVISIFHYSVPISETTLNFSLINIAIAVIHDTFHAVPIQKQALEHISFAGVSEYVETKAIELILLPIAHVNIIIGVFVYAFALLYVVTVIIIVFIVVAILTVGDLPDIRGISHVLNRDDPRLQGHRLLVGEIMEQVGLN